MDLLRKAVSLVKRCDLSQRRSEAEIARLQEELNQIDSRLALLDRQRDVLRAMLQQHQQPCVMNRAGLFAAQQRIAVCRQKLQALGLQSAELRELYAGLRQKQDEARRVRLQWQRKSEKFQRCVSTERRQMRMKLTLREESEIQEKFLWNR
jgi:chromosome segregation ATPase